MQPVTWLQKLQFRRGLAVTCVVLSAGGLVLLRSASAAYSSAMIPTASSAALSGARGASHSVAEFRGPSLFGSVALSQAQVVAGQSQTIYADVTLRGERRGEAEVRAKTALAVVFDSSGSMNGEKIDQAKRSIVKLIDAMRDDDEIAFIRYSSQSETLQPLGRVGDVRSALLRRIDALQADGGTNIPAGLSAGSQALTEADLGRARRVILVSDGFDASCTQSERLATNAAGHGVVVSSLGIGADFDESYMSAVAARGHGNFAFAKDGQALGSFLRRELDEAATTVASNVEVRLTLPEGTRFLRAYGAEGSARGREVILAAGSLFAGDERHVLIALETSFQSGEFGAFSTHIAWNAASGHTAEATLRSLTVLSSNDPRRVDGSRIPDVFGRAMSVVASQRQVDATEAYASGDKRRAGALIQQNTDELRAAARAAPPGVARTLDAQAKVYECDKAAFEQAAPGTEEGKIHAKSVMARDVGSLGREATYR